MHECRGTDASDVYVREIKGQKWFANCLRSRVAENDVLCCTFILRTKTIETVLRRTVG